MTLSSGAYRTGTLVPGLPMNNELPVDAVLTIHQPHFPQFRFEWHPHTKKVFVLRMLDDTGRPLPGNVRRGELVALHPITTHGDAINAVLIWLRGYRTRDHERERNPALKAEDY